MKDRGPKPVHSQPQNLHAPWRMTYMEMLSADERAARKAAEKPAEKPAAPAPSFLRDYYLHPERDEANHVIVRTGRSRRAGEPASAMQPDAPDPGGLILLNRYPYANGHVLVSLGDPRPRLLDYDVAQRAELWSMVDLAVDLVERALGPHGVNVGLNQGSAAGAGVPGHVHVHVVPRWSGDVNFMEVCAQIRVIPSALDDMARRMRDVWARIRPGGSAGA